MTDQEFNNHLIAIMELFATTQVVVEGIPLDVEMIREENFETVAKVISKLHEYRCTGQRWPEPIEWQEMFDLEPMFTP